MRPTQLLIADQWTAVSDGATTETVDPATGEVIGTFAEATVADVDAAVAAARTALPPDAWPGRIDGALESGSRTHQLIGGDR